MSEKLYLEFKYLRNRMFDIGDGRQYPIPMQMRNDLNALGHLTLLPIFDMEKIHRVDLLDETPQLPVREVGMSERYHEELCDEAYRIARENRKVNDEVRRRVQRFVDSGTIGVTHDPFKRETVADSDTSNPAKPKVKKPSEIAKEMDAQTK